MKLSDLQTHSHIATQDHDPEYGVEWDRTAFAREVAAAAAAVAVAVVVVVVVKYRTERGMSQPAAGNGPSRRPGSTAYGCSLLVPYRWLAVALAGSSPWSYAMTKDSTG